MKRVAAIPADFVLKDGTGVLAAFECEAPSQSVQSRRTLELAAVQALIQHEVPECCAVFSLRDPRMIDSYRSAIERFDLNHQHVVTLSDTEETLSLTRDDFDRNAGTVSVTKTLEQTDGQGILVKQPKSEKDQRCVQVPAWYFEMSSDHYRRLDRQARDNTDAYQDLRLVFPDASGGYLKPDPISGQVGAPKTAAGWPRGVASLHGLQHKFGSTLAHSGPVGLKDLAHAMGHADEAFTLKV